VQVGTESYGLKYLERLTGYERHGGIEHGAGAVVEYEHYMNSGDPAVLEEIARITRTTWPRRWPFATGWSNSASSEILGARTCCSTTTRAWTPTSWSKGCNVLAKTVPEHLLGDLLTIAPRALRQHHTKFAQAASDFGALYDDRDFIANLKFQGFEDSLGSKGVVTKNAIFTWPAQVVDVSFKRQCSVLFTGIGIEQGYGYLPEIDLSKRVLKMRWRERYDELGGLPSVMTLERLHLSSRETSCSFISRADP